jgi:His/Glu/Gln/Arg/opine family amino acid ABC transporter permease subunit
MSYSFQFGVLAEYGSYISAGIWYTMYVGLWSIIFSTLIGLAFASMQLSSNRLLKIIVLVYVDIFRTIPLVCLLVWVHYVLPLFVNFGFSSSQSAILSLSLNGGALACEAFRGGLEAIPQTQKQAAHSLGFSHIGTLRHVIIPQAIFSTLPAITNVYITNIKNVTVTMIVSVPEIMFRAQEIAVQTFRPLELYTGAAVLYIALIVVFSYGMRSLEKLQKWETI